MSIRLPFETVLFNSEKILSGVILCSDNKEDDYYDEYITYLHSCGWDEKDFDAEMLKMIDRDFMNMWRRAFFTLN